MKARKLFALLLVLLMLLSLTACGGSAAAEDNYYSSEMEMAPGAAPEEGLSKSEAAANSQLPADRKLIRTIDIQAETEDMAALTEDLTGRITALGGYVEAKNLYNGSTYSGYIRRNLSMTVRIPADKADEFISRVSENSNIVSSTEYIDDVTLQYVDTESHVKALETEQERLLTLLEQADKLEDILALEERLTQVRYELERYASQLRTLDNQITYATINLSVTEVKEYTPVQKEEPTAWERITEGFSRSLKDIGNSIEEFLIWVAVNSPYLLIWGVVLTVAILLLRRRRKDRSARRRMPIPPTEETKE